MNHIVGLDLSLTGTGLACTCGQLKLIGRDGITKLPLTERLDAVRDLKWKIAGWITHHLPRLIVLEQPAFSRTGGGAVERHALWWSVANELAISEYMGPLAEVGPTALKRYAIGKGACRGKGPLLDSLARRLPMFDTGGDDNLVDAAWLAAMGADHLGVPLVEMPAANRAALAKVTWPEVA